ncbi:MAG: hypothetical protein ACXV7D_14360, partial [Thermoanaerobaculia bacterium]
LINASARSTIAQAQLRETLTVMSTRVVPEASITIPLDGRRIDEHAMVADAGIAAELKRVMDELARAAASATSVSG